MNEHADESLSVKDVGLEHVEDKVLLRVAVRNDSERTVHAYATARRIEYDPQTRALKIELSDENREPTPVEGTFVRPKFVAVDPGSDRTIELRLPDVMHRIGPESDNNALAFEALPIHEAATVEVKLAWSDTPFYPDVREPYKAPLEQLKDWQKGVARGSARIEGTEAGS